MLWGILSVLFAGYLGVRVVGALAKRVAPAIRVRRRGERAQGVVTAVKVQEFERSAARLPRPVVTFTDAHGRRAQFMETFARPGSVQLGDHVSVYYDPADPEHTATIAAGPDVRRQVVLGGLVFLVFAAIFVNGLLLMAGVVR